MESESPFADVTAEPARGSVCRDGLERLLCRHLRGSNGTGSGRLASAQGASSSRHFIQVAALHGHFQRQCQWHWQLTLALALPLAVPSAESSDVRPPRLGGSAAAFKLPPAVPRCLPVPVPVWLSQSLRGPGPHWHHQDSCRVLHVAQAGPAAAGPEPAMPVTVGPVWADAPAAPGRRQ